jgi:hypothetical protein
VNEIHMKEKLKQKVESETQSLWCKFGQWKAVTTVFEKLRYAIISWSGIVQNSFVHMREGMNDDEFIQAINNYKNTHEECFAHLIKVIEIIKKEDGNEEVYCYINPDEILYTKQRIDNLLEDVKKLEGEN